MSLRIGRDAPGFSSTLRCGKRRSSGKTAARRSKCAQAPEKLLSDGWMTPSEARRLLSCCKRWCPERPGARATFGDRCSRPSRCERRTRLHEANFDHASEVTAAIEKMAVLRRCTIARNWKGSRRLKRCAEPCARSPCLIPGSMPLCPKRRRFIRGRMSGWNAASANLAFTESTTSIARDERRNYSDEISPI